jgi:hypothetical protein
VFRQAVVVTVRETDRYGRTVGTVWVDRLNANAEMIRQGQAWVYRQYLRGRSLLALEDEARQAKRGLWALPEAERVPPWQWRRQGQSSQPAPVPLPRAPGSGGRRISDLQLRRQAPVPRDVELRRGVVSLATMRAEPAGWRPRWRALRKPLPIRWRDTPATWRPDDMRHQAASWLFALRRTKDA